MAGNKERITIGLIIGRLDEQYQTLLWPVLTEFAEKNDINLKLFIGAAPPSRHGMQGNFDVIKSLINKENVHGLLIATGVMSDYYYQEEIINFCRYFEPLPVVSLSMAIKGIPSISVENKIGITSVIKHLIEVHKYERIAFIMGPKTSQEAEERFFAYCTTLSDYDIDLDMDLVVPGNFSKASGRKAIDILLDERGKKVDAIVAADDDMAIGAINALQERNIRVPYDIAVVGFDDTDEAGFLTPLLTTVKQPYREQIEKGAMILLDMINGATHDEHILLPGNLVIRQSCGCFADNFIWNKAHKTNYSDEKIEALLKEKRDEFYSIFYTQLTHSNFKKDKIDFWIHSLLDAFYKGVKNKDKSEYFLLTLNDILIQIFKQGNLLSLWKKALISFRDKLLQIVINSDSNFYWIEAIFQKAESLINELMLRYQSYNKMLIESKVVLLRGISHTLITSFELGELLDVVAYEVPKLNINSCYISLYSETVTRSEGAEDWAAPDISELVLAYDQSGRIINSTVSYSTKRLLPDKILDRNKRFTIIIMPLFFKEEQFGFIIFDLGPKIGVIYETLRGQISSAIKGALLFKDLKNALNALEKSNKKLHSLSLKDELTGLFNRRGFFSHSKQYLKLARRDKGRILLIFVDLDGLKQINDVFGHKEGDHALITAAKILSDTFRQADILARIGGDEFTILTLNKSLEDVSGIKKRLEQNVKKYNKSSEKPYEISMSLGVASFVTGNSVTIDDLMAEADRELYKQKKLKKKKKGNK